MQKSNNHFRMLPALELGSFLKNSMVKHSCIVQQQVELNIVARNAVTLKIPMSKA